MPNLSTADDFLALVSESNLLSDSCLAKLRRQAEGVSAEKLAASLRKERILTKFQTDRLLAGKKTGFFLGKYRILDLLGNGGMGKVYLAEQTNMKRPVALKLLPLNENEHHSTLARFAREARAVAKLSHPHIAQAYDFDQLGGMHYFAMEYVEGLTGQELVKHRGKIPFALAAHLVCQAANGLDHARKQGMVHRDIKPGNLMIQPDLVLKILDLGLVVQQVGASEDDPLTMLQKDVVLGTADYIAPEQAIDSHNVDIRADIYSLGCVLYFFLTGQSPYLGKTTTQKLYAHQHLEPKPVRDFAPDVPEKMVAVLAKMLAKDPDDRFAKPREVREALQEFARPLRPFERSAVKYPRDLVDQYIRHGGAPASTSSSSRIRRGPVTTDTRSTPALGPDTTAAPAPTAVLDPASRPSPRPAPTPRKKSKLPWVIAAVAVVVLTGAAGLGAAGLFADSDQPPVANKPDVPAAPVPERPKPRPAAPKTEREVVLKPTEGTVLAAAQNVADGGLVVFDGGDRPSESTVIDGSLLKNGGRFVLHGRGGASVTRSDEEPVFIIAGTTDLIIENLTIDGADGRGPVVIVRGPNPGLTFRNVKFLNCRSQGVITHSVAGTKEKPVRFVDCEFAAAGSSVGFWTDGSDEPARNVEILGCTFEKSYSTIDVAQPITGLTVRDCEFELGNVGLRFRAGATYQDSFARIPISPWRITDWRPLADLVDFVPRADEVAGGPRTADWPWRDIEEKWGRVPLVKELGEAENAYVYGHAEVVCETACRRTLMIGVDDEMVIWVNGKEVFRHIGHQPQQAGEFLADVDFKAGKNHVWVRVINGRTVLRVQPLDGPEGTPACGPGMDRRRDHEQHVPLAQPRAVRPRMPDR